MNKETYKLLKRKKRNGLELFYERYARRLFRYATQNWNCDEDTAWDLIYNTFDSVIENIEKYSFASEEKFGSFVLTAFLNRLRNHFRISKNQQGTILMDDVSMEFQIEESQTDGTDESSLMQLLKNELQKLEDWERMLLLLRAQQMPYSEIARYVDKPEKQLKVYYQRLKNRLENEIKFKMEEQNG